MSKVYLSPSTQEYNKYVDVGDEEYWMNIITDKMEPFLRADGIEFDRNDPDTSAATPTASRASAQRKLLRII